MFMIKLKKEVITINVKDFNRGDRIQITKNFHSDEFACKDGCKKILIDVDLVFVLQKIRDEIGSAITINSGYRTIPYNKKVGGAKNSYHIKGRAFDISSKTVDPRRLAKIAEKQGLKGIIRYQSFIHIDSREKKYWFDNVSNKTVNTFNIYTLRYGDRGSDVKILQRFLGVVDDGIFGNNTLVALKKFQSENHLAVDGILGSNTLKKLEEAGCHINW